MKMWSIKVITLLLFCYARPLIGEVKFNSSNFYNTLYWDPAKTASPEEKMFYSVQYKRDDEDQFQIKKECQNITALLCDLTAETPSIYDIQYDARVFVNGGLYGQSPRFKPLAETTLGPPELSINTKDSSLLIKATMPLGPNGNPIADILNRSTNGHSKNQIIYSLNITEPGGTWKIEENTNGLFVINQNNNQRRYCGYVVYKPVSEWGRPQSEGASFCEELPGDYRTLLLWLLTGAALLATIIMILLLYMWNYAKGGKLNTMPHSLVNLPTQQKVLHCPDETDNIKEAVVCTTKTVFVTIPVSPKLPSFANGGYSPQDIIFLDCTGTSVGTDKDSPTSNTQDTSAQSSEIYSVVAVHVPTKENKDIQQPTTDDQTNNLPLFSSGEAWIKGMGPTLAIQQNVDATESTPTKPLLLDTVRSPNGQLMLSSLFSLLQSSGDDDVSPFPSENKPLLSDLINIKIEGPSLASLQSFENSEWSDSGCDDSINTPTICSSFQPDFHQACQNTPHCEAMFESSYKQNWMPEIILGPARKEF